MPAQFARLRIAGFKSFADPTLIEILPGLTGIVGPNGCGKSNVVDALRWVMGEASAKSMRGGEMDDVIFAGTLSRPARSIGEVAISLSETAGLAFAPFQNEAELQISRKIERGGGSTYRINGREARARDVATLFADLASGSRNSAMISQGRVSALVNARPDERRAILEEAAGISGLHARRHEAELKLRATEQNLTRSDDLRAQHESRLADLRKQARQANRYRTLSSSIAEAEAACLAIEHEIALSGQAAARAAMSEAQRLVHAAQGARDEALASERLSAETIPAHRAREGDARTALERARIDLEQIEADIARTAKARAEAQARLATLVSDHRHAERTLADAETARARLSDEQTKLEAEHALAPARQQAAATTAQQLAERLEQAETRLHRATEASVHHAAIRQTITSQLKQARDQANEAAGRASQARAAQQRATAELIAPERLAGAIEARDRAEAVRRAAETHHAATEQAVRDAEAARIATSLDAATARGRAIAADSEFAHVRAEFHALDSILAQKFGTDPDPILDRIKVPAGLETALGAALRAELAAGTSPDAPRFWRALPPAATHPALQPLADLIEAPAVLHRALNAILLLPDQADGDALQATLNPGEILVGADGALWRWDGFIARAGAPNDAALRLAQRNRLAVLQGDLASAVAEAAACKTVRIAAEQAEQSARDAEQAARAERKAAESAIDRTRAAARTLADTAARLAADAERQATRQAAANDLCVRLDAEHAQSSMTLAAAQAACDVLDDPTVIRVELDAARADLAALRRAESAVRLDLQRHIADAELRERRRATIQRETIEWADRAQDAASRLTDLAARLIESRAAVVAMPTDAAITAQRDGAGARRALLQSHHEAAARALADAERQATSAAATARQAEQHVAVARETLIVAEAGLRAADHAWGTIAERILDRLGVNPALPAVGEPTAAAAEHARKRFDRLARERDDMGPVNLRAEIEVAEIERSLAAIQREHDEITTAIAKLRGSIGHLNHEGRERLSTVFTEIDRHFQALFTRMFGGGRAHLALTGADDPLRAGLEIFAEPPGKKLATLSLLSGGEQALTALSLIFAVFRCNPAPISVLDEVDAPLDDANVDRFCTLLDDMTRETGTRFLVVTHHHLTMARMDRLYGVTMQERGISRILSVDLGTATSMVEQSAMAAA